MQTPPSEGEEAARENVRAREVASVGDGAVMPMDGGGANADVHSREGPGDGTGDLSSSDDRAEARFVMVNGGAKLAKHTGELIRAFRR